MDKFSVIVENNTVSLFPVLWYPYASSLQVLGQEWQEAAHDTVREETVVQNRFAHTS